jgi:hypothetical protein
VYYYDLKPPPKTPDFLPLKTNLSPPEIQDIFCITTKKKNKSISSPYRLKKVKKMAAHSFDRSLKKKKKKKRTNA